MTDNAKQKLCTEATDFIIEQVNSAIRTLQGTSLIVNGFHILSDVPTSRNSIAAARDNLQKALERIAATEWPTRSDYDRW